MALLSDLVKSVAKVEGIDEVSVGIFARAAREAGYIKQKGRGRGAAHMAVRDAANLLLAVNGCPLAKDVESRLPVFRALPWHSTDLWWLPRRHSRLRGLFLGSHRCLGDWLEHVIELAGPEADGSSQLSRMLEAVQPKRDVVRAQKLKLQFGLPKLEIQFWLARPSTVVELRIPNISTTDSTACVESSRGGTVVYEAADADNNIYRGDRSAAIVITDSTITEVARVLRT